MKSQNTSTNGTSLKKTVKAVRVFSILLLFILFGSVSAFAQAVGDYRSSVNNGNWGTRGNWQRWNGTTWATPTAGEGYPGQNASPTTVTIRNGFNIILNVSVANAIGNLVVGDGSGGNLETDNTARTITVTTALTVNANSTLGLEAMTITNNGTTNVYGSLTDISTTGANIFVGLFRVYNGGSFTLTSGETCEFRGGIINDGTFNKTGAGAITFSTNNQSISGSGAITMNGAITVSAGVTVTNNSTNLNLTSTANPAITGTGTWRQGANSVLNTSAASINISTFDCSTNVNTVSFNRNNAQNIPAATFHNLTITNGNTKTLAGIVTVNNDFTLNTGTAINPAGFNFTVSGNTVLAGTLADGTVAGTTSFQNVNLSGGAINGGATGVVNINGNLSVATANGTLGRADITVNGTTTISASRTLTLNSNTGVKTFAGAVTNDGTWTSTTVTTAANLVFQNGFTNNSATNAALGAATFSTNNQSLAGTGSFTFTSASIISGAVTLTNNSSHVNGVTFTGTINGTIAGSTLANGASRSLYYRNATQPMATGILDASAAGNSFYYNLNNAQTVKGATYHNLLIQSGNTKTLGGNVTVNNDFTLATATTVNPVGFDMSVSGSTVLTGLINDNNASGTVSLADVNLSGGTITGSVASAVNINGALSIATANGTIGLVTLTVNGATSISASRTLTLNSNTGVKTFAGAVTNDGTWTSTTVTTAANLVFQNGFTNNSATNAALGAATFSTNNQALAGTGSFTFTSASIISGAITLTNNSSHVNGVTFTGTINGTIAGSTLANGASRVMYYNNATQPMATGILDASAAGNSFYYNLAGAQAVKGATYHNLFIQNGNTKTLSGNATVNNTFTLTIGTTFNPAGLDMTVSGSTVLAGTLADGTVTGTTTLQDVNLSGGTINGAAAGVVNINGTLSVASANGTIGLVTLTVNGATSISASRTLTLNNNTGIKTFAGAVTNAGTWTSTVITTTANLVFQNGFTNNSATNAALGAATFSTNNQALAGTGSFTFANPVIVSGAITLTNNSSSASGVTFNNTVDGTIAGSTLANGINAIINYQPAVATPPMNTGLLDASANGNTFNYNRNIAQTVKAATYHNLGILNGNTKSLSGATIVNGNLSIVSPTTLDITASNYALSVGGNWSNAGTFNARNGTVTFNGSVSQSITPNTSNFYDVVFNNTANGTSAIVLNADVTVSNSCNMTDGIISTGSNRLILTNTTAANLSGFGNGSYVNGNLRRNIATNTSTYVFPVGSSANYYRADIKNNNLTGITYIDASYSALARHDDADLDVNDGPMLTYVSISSNMWTIDPNAAPSGGSYDVYLYTGNVSGLTDNEFAVVKRPTGSPDGTSWTTGGGTINAGGGDGRKLSDGYALRMGLTSFSEFGIGSTTPSNPLPIQLVSFNVKMNKTGVADLTWVTATEINNDFFTIERSVDGVNFEEVKTIKGAGNSSRTLTYKTTDAKPLKGVSYYRLKQTDYDGTYTYSNIVSLTNNGLVSTASVAQNWTVYPNPMNAGGFMNIYAENYEAKATVTVYEATTGKQVVEATIESENTSLSLDENVKPGIYLVRIVSGEKTTTKRMIIQ